MRAQTLGLGLGTKLEKALWGGGGGGGGGGNSPYRKYANST